MDTDKDATSTFVSQTELATEWSNRSRNRFGYLQTTTAPHVSFIVLSYNNGAYLSETLRSISSQSFRDFEILIADDGSIDGSTEIIRSFVKTSTSPCLAILSEKNQGIGNNYNNALRYAQGEYIAHIGSDDVNYPERLVHEVDALTATGASMCIAGIEIMDKYSNKLRDAFARTDCHTLDFALATGLVHVTSPTMMYKRNLIDLFGLLPEGLANEDEALAFRALCSGGIVVTDAILVRYRLHSASVTSGARSTSLSAYIRWLSSNLPFQIANKQHWREILHATSLDSRIPSVDALLSDLEAKRLELGGIVDRPMMLLRLLVIAQGRAILWQYAIQQLRNLRYSWLEMRARQKRRRRQ